MKRDRNHEGYHDPTAEAAIRRARKREKVKDTCPCLTYRLEEARGFQLAAKQLR